MSERTMVPALMVCRPVLNIGQRHIEGLRNRLLEEVADTELASEASFDGLFSSGDGLYSQIIARGEFLRIQRDLGRDQLDDEAVGELKSQLEDTLSDRAELEVATLPVLLQHWGESPKLALRVAYSSDVANERWLARNVIRKFLGMEKLPRRWFSRAKRIVPVQLATSHSDGQLELLNRLSTIIEKEVPNPIPDTRPLLPATTWLASPDVQISP